MLSRGANIKPSQNLKLNTVLPPGIRQTTGLDSKVAGIARCDNVVQGSTGTATVMRTEKSKTLSCCRKRRRQYTEKGENAPIC